jgi:hypothetical protein
VTGWEGPVIGFGLRQLLEAFKSRRSKGFSKADRQLLSTVIRDLLAIDPDITRAEATIAALKATGAPPDTDLITAERLLGQAKARPPKKKMAKRGRASFTRHKKSKLATRTKAKHRARRSRAR